MREAVICSPVRTPVGRFGGALRDVDAETLAATVVEAVLQRTGIDPAVFDDSIFGHCYPNGETPAMGRLAVLHAGLPVEVPGFQLDRRCGSGLQAICLGAMEVQTGVADVVLAGGVESMSSAEFYTTSVRWGPNRGSINLVDRLDRGRVTAGTYRYPVEGGMLETAENLRRQYSIPRNEYSSCSLRGMLYCRRSVGERQVRRGDRVRARAQQARRRDALRPRRAPTRGYDPGEAGEP